MKRFSSIFLVFWGFLLSATATTHDVFRGGPLFHNRTDNTPYGDNLTVGRYAYIGNVPKFKTKDLEIYVSRMGLTLRVKAWVTREVYQHYATTLFKRWKRIVDALQSDKFMIYPLYTSNAAYSGASQSQKVWLNIARQYTQHMLDGFSGVFKSKRVLRGQEYTDYKAVLSDALLQYYFGDLTLTAAQVLTDEALQAQLVAIENSATLFKYHLGHLFTADITRYGYQGYLTFVYPIAAGEYGPYQPVNTPSPERTSSEEDIIPLDEGVYPMKLANSMDARWWSEKYKDMYGGFPFLLLTWHGYAIHGPITNYGIFDAWYLRRGHVSHGCFRMNASDVMELRMMLPYNKKEDSPQVKVVVLDYFDVVDWNQSGQEKALDVLYYYIPFSGPGSSDPHEFQARYSIEYQKKVFWKTKYAQNYFSASQDVVVNAVRYQVEGMKLKRVGRYTRVPIERFALRPNALLQYIENPMKWAIYSDVLGVYPPNYFMRNKK